MLSSIIQLMIVSDQAISNHMRLDFPLSYFCGLIFYKMWANLGEINDSWYSVIERRKMNKLFSQKTMEIVLHFMPCLHIMTNIDVLEVVKTSARIVSILIKRNLLSSCQLSNFSRLKKCTIHFIYRWGSKLILFKVKSIPVNGLKGYI